MKRILLIIIGLAVILSFNGCGKNDSPGDNHNGAGQNTADSKEKDGNQESKNGEIDLDKLPPRLKEAVESGKMTKEKAKEIMARMKDGKWGGQGMGPEGGEWNGGGSMPTVKVEQTKRQPINAFLVLNGAVEPERKVEVYSRLSAYVKSIVREEGDFVDKGAILAYLDDTEIRISYRQAEIQLKQAELTLKDEEANINRSQKLKETEMISEQDFQTAQAKFSSAKLDYQNKLENYKNLELQMGYTQVKSPVEGYVTQRLMEVGSRVNSNQQVFTVEDFSPLLVRVYVPSADIANLKTGMPVEVTTDTIKGMVFNGRIKLINPRIDVQSGTIKVTVETVDNTRHLKPGMFVETKILIRNNPEALVIPRNCIIYKQNEAYVFIFNLKDMQVSQRAIKTGIAEGNNMEVLEGLDEGEQIVTVGVDGLKDQMKVRPVK